MNKDYKDPKLVLTADSEYFVSIHSVVVCYYCEKRVKASGIGQHFSSVCTLAQTAKGMSEKIIQEKKDEKRKKRNASERKKRLNPEKNLQLSIKRWYKNFYKSNVHIPNRILDVPEDFPFFWKETKSKELSLEVRQKIAGICKKSFKVFLKQYHTGVKSAVNKVGTTFDSDNSLKILKKASKFSFKLSFHPDKLDPQIKTHEAHEEMKSVFNLFFTKYQTFEDNLTTANRHVKTVKKWKERVGLTDISKLNGIYEGYKKGDKVCCSYCLKQMKTANDLDVYCVKHSMINGVNVKSCIREFWLTIQNAINSIDQEEGFGNTEELALRWDEEKKRRILAYNNRIEKKNKKSKSVPKKRKKKLFPNLLIHLMRRINFFLMKVVSLVMTVNGMEKFEIV